MDREQATGHSTETGPDKPSHPVSPPERQRHIPDVLPLSSDDHELQAAMELFEQERELNKKRKRENPNEGDEEVVAFSTHKSAVQDIEREDDLYENDPAYAASKFGGIAEYLRHKRQKL